ncbi:MAG TPA: hypoxanthine phosphoribosyltransferase [Bacteroidales bacterium]|jgi:hypoxanthine phosphoribosyltransferase|nr:hypoxanthine phosphoribosyltransferase [Bacteroidales bacterium]MDI9573732.1 hypoxanthine phosphoribosyltransferase [Bacteroidota bacterium]OQC58874.1 MAG: Hypoxanthine phosphoribosyltransferase [Bacteroidetes bacterium ADurb.Bin012]MBP9512630.1 hypoxanthine phosphoribosyltransferase [Bacteroidales bacterium]MBP9588845.1 hypoxanthine phosphoribosyltransferase [Bacteroidales bacterium]
MEKTIQLHDKTFTIYIKASQIEEAIEKIAQQINEDIGHKKPIFLVILNGAFLFAADLIRKYSGECEVSFVKLSSYYGTLTTTRVREIIGLENDVKGRTVVIVEDIVDTGITMDNIVKKLIGLGAGEVKITALLFKPDAFRKNFKIDYLGFEIPNDFIVGYGLDYNGLGRNLPDIYQIVKTNS